MGTIKLSDDFVSPAISKFDAIENYTIIRSNGQVTVTPNNA